MKISKLSKKKLSLNLLLLFLVSLIAFFICQNYFLTYNLYAASGCSCGGCNDPGCSSSCSSSDDCRLEGCMAPDCSSCMSTFCIDMANYPCGGGVPGVCLTTYHERYKIYTYKYKRCKICCIEKEMGHTCAEEILVYTEKKPGKKKYLDPVRAAEIDAMEEI